ESDSSSLAVTRLWIWSRVSVTVIGPPRRQPAQSRQGGWFQPMLHPHRRSRLNVALSRGPGAVHTLDGATISTTSCLAHGHPPLTCAGRVSKASLALNDPRVGVDPGAA